MPAELPPGSPRLSPPRRKCGSHWKGSAVIHVSWRQGDAERFPDLLPGYSYATRQKPHDFHLCESDLSPGSILFLLSAALLKEDRGRVSSNEDFNLCSTSSPLGQRGLFPLSCSACGSTQLCSFCCACSPRAYSSLLPLSQSTHEQERVSSQQPYSRSTSASYSLLNKNPRASWHFPPLHRAPQEPFTALLSALSPISPWDPPENGLHLVGAEGVLPPTATPMLPTSLLLPTAGPGLPGTNAIPTSSVLQGTITSDN